MLIAFDDMKADMEGDKKLKKLNPVNTELILRRRKLNISPVFRSQSYFKLPKTIIINTTQYFIMKVSNKRELQQEALNHLSDTEFRDFMKLYKV